MLATGSSAATLPVPGADAPQILRIRHAVDAERLLERVDAGGDVLVIGSGFIGCEVAASLRRRGTAVTMATMESAPQADRLGAEVGEILAGWLADAGVTFHGGVALDHIEHGNGGSTAVFGDRRIDAAHVILATGARPNLDVARAAGMAGDSGVDVDARMATALDGVMAIGDIAHALHPVAGRRLRVEHWGDAEGMGQVAGTVAAGGAAEWRDVPGFWSQIGERAELKYVAWGDGYDECVVRRSADGGFTAWYAKDGATCGVLTHRHDEDHEAAAELISVVRPAPRPPLISPRASGGACGASPCARPLGASARARRARSCSTSWSSPNVKPLRAVPAEAAPRRRSSWRATTLSWCSPSSSCTASNRLAAAVARSPSVAARASSA